MRVAPGRALIGALLIAGAGCADAAAGPEALPWPGAVRWPEAIRWPALTPDPHDGTGNGRDQDRDQNQDQLPARVELGRLLFYDPILSADRDTACATCHSEIWGMSDGLSLSIGTGGDLLTGPGREGPRVTRRNAQTLWNAAYRESLFWDGRAGGLEAQALSPLREATELGRDPDAVVAELTDVDAYADLFAEAFGEGPTRAGLASALAAFQRTLISDRAPYDRYVGGDRDALDEASLRGMWVFAEAGCHTCHTPPRFESERYADRGVAPAAGGAAPGTDAGRFEVTSEPDDRGRFRVPTLRNLRETGPYFHAGSERDMAAAIAHEAEVQRRAGLAPALDAEALADLTAFIGKGLMDRSREPDRPESVPSGLPVPRDGFRIPR